MRTKLAKMERQTVGKRSLLAVLYRMVKRDQFELGRASLIALWVVPASAGIVLYKLHVAQKWDAAFVGTVGPFWTLISIFRSRWGHVSFWTSLAGCFVVHVGLIWYVFAILMRNIDTVGLLVWTPVAIFEGIGLYYLIDLLDRKLQ